MCSSDLPCRGHVSLDSGRAFGQAGQRTRNRIPVSPPLTKGRGRPATGRCSLVSRYSRLCDPTPRHGHLSESGVTGKVSERDRAARWKAKTPRGVSRRNPFGWIQIFAGSQPARAAASSSRRMGLERWASMPARRHSSRSPGIELAVSCRAVHEVRPPDRRVTNFGQTPTPVNVPTRRAPTPHR